MSAVISPNIANQPKSETADKLLRQLLECVQECQKRYGGKTELATEFDSCVVALCLTLEAVLLHGIRVNPQGSALKQVASSLHLGGENPSFWPFVRTHLTKHEQERYAVLKHIWTDTGRGRAWIRAALNERSLERYFHILLSNQSILEIYYEGCAILRDLEKSSMLPNMAGGVGSILFAISIDKPELNSGIPPRIDSIKSKAEPIIEAPLSERPKTRKKKKVARQFISFDEDDSVLSTSVPSTSSSISSDTSTSNEQQQSSTKLKKILEENRMAENAKPRRKLSIETSGSREKFREIPETLTPVSHAEIGELTPVSVEINKNFESDAVVEVPTDISEVLTAVEARNTEELNKKQERIDQLSKENEILKEQVKKYVSAIQMLKNNENVTLEDLDINQQPDYQGEAKLFEKKLVQVAEMHAELMDFNVALQQSLCQKDQLVERLKAELEQLRGPCHDDDTEGEVSGNVNVWIPSAFLTGTGSSAHHVYQIFLRAGNDEWNIYRRYAQFYALHSDLKKLDPAVTSFDFPPKKSIGKKDSALVEERRKRLQVYLRRVLAHWPELSHCNSRFLLEQHLAFFKDQKDGEPNKGIFSPRRSRNTNDNHYAGL
ncbi:sorting nexin-29 isoform X2 [Tribolium castaneum]|nr:PREDICTED: sorting nexin-29 isoform X2 [Tribolium castaneum]|eukprot:XP_008198522.1 PREDICTED: sorting nexin-29 isoform X2 [Tribolium castaneum]